MGELKHRPKQRNDFKIISTNAATLAKHCLWTKYRFECSGTVLSSFLLLWWFPDNRHSRTWHLRHYDFKSKCQKLKATSTFWISSIVMVRNSCFKIQKANHFDMDRNPSEFSNGRLQNWLSVLLLKLLKIYCSDSGFIFDWINEVDRVGFQ